jgi:hypothetical protein
MGKLNFPSVRSSAKPLLSSYCGGRQRSKRLVLMKLEALFVVQPRSASFRPAHRAERLGSIQSPLTSFEYRFM